MIYFPSAGLISLAVEVEIQRAVANVASSVGLLKNSTLFGFARHVWPRGKSQAGTQGMTPWLKLSSSRRTNQFIVAALLAGRRNDCALDQRYLVIGVAAARAILPVNAACRRQFAWPHSALHFAYSFPMRCPCFPRTSSETSFNWEHKAQKPVHQSGVRWMPSIEFRLDHCPMRHRRTLGQVRRPHRTARESLS